MQIRKFAPIGLLFVLGACAMPVGFTTLSYTMNGISYASSGKGVADHALSAATDQDCAVLRAVQGVDICGSADRGDAAGLMTMVDPGSPVRKSIAISDRQQPFTASTSPDNRSAGIQTETEKKAAVSASESIYGSTRQGQ